MPQNYPSTRGLTMHTSPAFKAINRPSTSFQAINRPSGSATKATSSLPTNRPKRVAELKWDELIIAIDYGTTFLTVAYLFIDGNKPKTSVLLADILKDIRVIRDDWPGSHDDSPTVPTEGLYADLDGYSDPRVWFTHELDEAFNEKEAPEGAKHVRLAKLLLHDAKETEIENRRLREWAQESGKNEFEFIKDFLGFIHKSILKYFEEHHRSYLTRTHWKYVIGCPPAWSMSEHRKMADIATDAKMPAVFMGSEAEAQLAKYLAGCEKSSLKVGQKSFSLFSD